MLKKLDLFIILILLTTALVACGNDSSDKKPKPQTTQPPTLPPDATATETFLPDSEVSVVQTPEVMLGTTPQAYQIPQQILFDKAAAIAQKELAARLNIQPGQITPLSPDVPLAPSGELQCPALGSIEATTYHLFLQFERFIYPYQFYLSDMNNLDSLFVQPCDKVLNDKNALYIVEDDPQLVIIDKVQEVLQEQNIDATSGDYNVQPMTWPNTALGCMMSPDIPLTPALVEGYLVQYKVGDRVYEVHTDQAGNQIEVCEAPKGYSGVQAFISALEKDGQFTVQLTEEVARYSGLDHDGVLLLLMPMRARIGVLGFDTSEATRTAAQQIKDPSAAHIFVSGQVLIVAEDPSPQVYSMLSRYAEIVRSPILESLETGN